MSRANILITIAVAMLTVALWAWVNRPEQEPPWPSKIPGFCFSPMHADHDPIQGRFPTEEQIDADLAFLSRKILAVRTYTVEQTMAEVPRLAAKHKINVTLGAWIDQRLDHNEQELQKLLEILPQHKNIVRVMVGNEAILRGEISLEQMYEYLDRVREKTDIPVSTAEPWHVWLKNPELAEHVDYLAVHMLPFWEGVSLDKSIDFIVRNMNALKAAFPGKRIVIAEVGWPSYGRSRKAAVPSTANEATFLRRFLTRAKQEGYIYYVMEAFDQPWKKTSEGAVGAYWGVWDVERQPKFEFTEPIVNIRNWYVLAGLSVLVAAITLAFLLTDSRTLRTRGRSFLAIIAFMAATLAVWIVYDYTQQYLTLGTLIIGILLMLGMVGVLLVLFTEAHEWAEALWVKERRRQVKLAPIAEAGLPMVSVHVPAYNEPPEMVIRTLDALAALDYPRFEVVVIDNNTRDTAVWEPVQAHCRQLGSRFHFHHVDPLQGFKAGALNYGLKQTHADATIVGVIDSDYVVHPRWLRDLVPQFQNPDIAIVQAPQDYADGGENAFKALCYAEYLGFFYIGMRTRNERNAIIQHGTMTLVRRSALDEVQGWNERSITEDAELGLSIFEKGHEAVYVPKSYGRGVMPDNFLDYKKQRFRWAFGAMRILRQHAGVLAGRAPSSLTRGQRYHFVAGWLPWIADSMNFFFTLGALFWSLSMVIAPKQVDPPMVAFSLLPMMLLIFKITKMYYIYRAEVSATVRQALAAMLAGLSVSHTIAMAVLSGLFGKDRPFLRTPKLAHRLALLKAITAAREEFLLAVALWTSAIILSMSDITESIELFLWIMMLLVLSMPYFAAVLVSLLSTINRLPAAIVGPMQMIDRIETATPATVEKPAMKGA